MGRSSRTPGRIIVVPKLPEDNVPEYIRGARSIVERMGVSPWFPAPVPPLAVVAVAIDELDAAETSMLTRAKGNRQVRDEKLRELRSVLDHLRAHVESVANAHPEQAASIAETAGMYLKDKRGPGRRGFHATQPRSGDVDLHAPSAGDRASYEFQYSLDRGVTWLPVAQAVATKASVTVRNLTPGATVLFRYRVTVKNVTSDWSDPISVIVG